MIIFIGSIARETWTVHAMAAIPAYGIPSKYSQSTGRDVRMLKVWGTLVTDQKVIKSDTFTSDKPDLQDALLECIEYFARAFDIEAPMWQSAHTKQLGLFRKATFKSDDFIDKIGFDKFELQILERD